MSFASAFTIGEIEALDSRSYVPLYMQLANRIAALIRAHGRHAVGKALPSEAECVQHLRVSRPTVRQAMAHLLAQGLIRREKGRGTFVAPLQFEHDVSHGFEDDMRAARRSVQYAVLDWRLVEPAAEIAGVLGTRASQCYFLRRTRSVEGKLIGIEERFLPQALGIRLTSEDLRRDPVLTLLERTAGKRPARLDIEVTGRGADAALARLLGVRKGTPLLMRTTTFRDDEGHALLHGTVTFLAEQYKFRFSVSYSAGRFPDDR